MFSPSATVLFMNTRRPLWAATLQPPSLRLRGLSHAAAPQHQPRLMGRGDRWARAGVGEPGADDEVDVLDRQPLDHPRPRRP